MKSNRSRLWIIILGGVIGLVLGAAIPYLLIDPTPRWERLTYGAIAPETDRAMELVGYDSHDGTLFIKGQSQTIYGCPAEPYNANSNCHEIKTETDIKWTSCPLSGGVRRFNDPQGQVISKVVIFDCRENGYWVVQTNYAVLDDGSLWKLTYNDFDLMTPFRNCLVIAGAIIGIAIGIGLSEALTGRTSHHSKNHPRLPA